MKLYANHSAFTWGQLFHGFNRAPQHQNDINRPEKGASVSLITYNLVYLNTRQLFILGKYKSVFYLHLCGTSACTLGIVNPHRSGIQCCPLYSTALMGLLGVLDFMFVNHACHSIITRGASVQLVFGFEVCQIWLNWSSVFNRKPKAYLTLFDKSVIPHSFLIGWFFHFWHFLWISLSLNLCSCPHLVTEYADATGLVNWVWEFRVWKKDKKAITWDDQRTRRMFSYLKT